MSINAIGYRRNQKECSHFGQLMISKSRTLFMRFQCIQNAEFMMNFLQLS